VEPTNLWAEALEGYELHLMAQGHSQSIQRNRFYSVRAMARHATKAGHEPGDLGKPAMQRYLLRQYTDRKGTGKETLYQELKNFWGWYSQTYEVPSPMDGIPRPGGESAEVPVLSPEQLPAIFKACTGHTPWETTRNLAILWLFLESGLRRFELCALDVADIDLKGRTVSVRRGKGGRARVAVFGDESAQALWRWLSKRGRAPGALFTSVRGDRLTTGGVSQLLARIKKRSGVQVRPHMLRHAWAHYSLDGGMREHDIMKLAGWSSSEMLKLYGAALAQERAIAAGRALQVGNIIRAGRGAQAPGGGRR
jgi:integrase